MLTGECMPFSACGRQRPARTIVEFTREAPYKSTLVSAPPSIETALMPWLGCSRLHFDLGAGETYLVVVVGGDTVSVVVIVGAGNSLRDPSALEQTGSAPVQVVWSFTVVTLPAGVAVGVTGVAVGRHNVCHGTSGEA